MISVGDLAAIIGITVTVCGLVGGAVAYLIRRRAMSGSVRTSDAATLWTQFQSMYAQTLADKNKAEEQRDRVIEIQTDQVLPLLTATNDSLRQILRALDDIDKRLSRIKVVTTQEA